MTYKCHRTPTTTSRHFRPTKLRVVSTSVRQRTPTLPDNDAITRPPTGALPVVTCVVRVIGRMDRPRPARTRRRSSVAGNSVWAENDYGGSLWRRTAVRRLPSQSAIDRAIRTHPSDRVGRYFSPTVGVPIERYRMSPRTAHFSHG